MTTGDSTTTLLPCPFCGGEAHLMFIGPTIEQINHAVAWAEDIDGGIEWVECSECGATGPEGPDKGDGKTNWNRRYASAERNTDA